MNIELQAIEKHFGPVHANKAISVMFPQGRIIGVLGENGAGKSTLMKILSGYQPADSGRILVDGVPVAYNGPLAAIRQGIGMLQQDPLDVAAFTVLENFSYGQPGGVFFGRGRGPEVRRTVLQQYSERFGFELPPDALVSELSIAQRQQLEIVRLLALGVRALILDEPTTGISADQKQRLFDALRALARDDGMVVLLVSHKLEDVIALCDEVIVLRAGALVGQRAMPATTHDLVALMFGQQPPQPERPASQIGAPILRLVDAHLRSERLDMRCSITMRAGEIVGLAGLDGSGQGLLMRACAGLQPLLGGRVLVDEVDLTGHPYRGFLQHGVVFGAAGRLEEGLIAGLTLTEHVALTMNREMLIDWPAARQRVADQIQHYAVRGRPDDRIEQLSGGNQQRMLMALLPERPRLLALEQPTRGLDVESAAWIWKQLLARREHGAAILFSSAELDEILTYSDRIIVFYAGQMFEVPDARSTSVEELGYLIGGAFVRGQQVAAESGGATR